MLWPDAEVTDNPGHFRLLGCCEFDPMSVSELRPPIHNGNAAPRLATTETRLRLSAGGRPAKAPLERAESAKLLPEEKEMVRLAKNGM